MSSTKYIIIDDDCPPARITPIDEFPMVEIPDDFRDVFFARNPALVAGSDAGLEALYEEYEQIYLCYNNLDEYIEDYIPERDSIQ